MTLLDLLHLMRKHLRVVIALPIVCAVAMGIFSFAIMPNSYTSDTTFYVLSQQSNSNNASSAVSDLNAGQMIANDIATLANSDFVLEDSAKSLGMQSLKGYKVSVTSATTSRVITLSVTGKDAQGSADVANAVANSISKIAKDSMGVDGFNIIDAAKTPTAPSGPNRVLYTAVAFLAGLFVAIAGIVLIDMLNTKIRDADDAEETLGIPVVGRMPMMKAGR